VVHRAASNAGSRSSRGTRTTCTPSQSFRAQTARLGTRRSERRPVSWAAAERVAPSRIDGRDPHLRCAQADASDPSGHPDPGGRSPGRSSRLDHRRAAHGHPPPHCRGGRKGSPGRGCPMALQEQLSPRTRAAGPSFNGGPVPCSIAHRRGKRPRSDTGPACATQLFRSIPRTIVRHQAGTMGAFHAAHRPCVRPPARARGQSTQIVLTDGIRATSHRGVRCRRAPALANEHGHNVTRSPPDANDPTLSSPTPTSTSPPPRHLSPPSAKPWHPRPRSSRSLG
jgi:hypothetical protein